MYHWIIRRKLLRVFAELDKGNYEYALASTVPRVEHSFAGTHALGGTRHSESGLRKWFGRLYRLFPGLHFTIKHISVSGNPRDTTATIEWHDSATTVTGGAYENDGVHVVRLRWGKLTSLHAYLDTSIVEEACRQMTAQGVKEANAVQIEE